MYTLSIVQVSDLFTKCRLSLNKTMFLRNLFLNISATIDHLQGIHLFAFEFAKVVKRDSFCSCKFYVFTSLFFVLHYLTYGIFGFYIWNIFGTLTYHEHMDVMTFKPVITPIFISHMLLPEDDRKGSEYAENLWKYNLVCAWCRFDYIGLMHVYHVCHSFGK